MQLVKKYLGGLVALAVCTALQTHAQFNFGGFGGGGQNQNRQQATTTYNSAGNVGNAQIMVDSDSHNLIITADDETTKAMMEVIKNLDHPQPQVLIKVVFIEVTHNNSLDIGIEGQYNGQSSAFGRIANYLTNYAIFTNTTITSHRRIDHDFAKHGHSTGAIDRANEQLHPGTVVWAGESRGEPQWCGNVFDPGRGFYGHVARDCAGRQGAVALATVGVGAK